MKNEKKVIEIIKNFPAILYNIKTMLDQENVDYILDASDFPQPVSLLTVANPDILLYNLKLSGKAAIEVLGTEMQNNMDIKLGMITTNPSTYYISLCSTFSSEYFDDKPYSREAMPGIVSNQQLN